MNHRHADRCCVGCWATGDGQALTRGRGHHAGGELGPETCHELETHLIILLQTLITPVCRRTPVISHSPDHTSTAQHSTSQLFTCRQDSTLAARLLAVKLKSATQIPTSTFFSFVLFAAALTTLTGRCRSLIFFEII